MLNPVHKWAGVQLTGFGGLYLCLEGCGVLSQRRRSDQPSREQGPEPHCSRAVGRRCHLPAFPYLYLGQKCKEVNRRMSPKKVLLWRPALEWANTNGPALPWMTVTRKRPVSGAWIRPPLTHSSSLSSDLALRNCFLTADLTVKVGDYGTGPSAYKVRPAELWSLQPEMGKAVAVHPS